MTENIHKEIKFESNLGFGTVSAESCEPSANLFCFSAIKYKEG
jgi:hypothetical protein